MNILTLGGTSGIAHEVHRIYAKRGDNFVLVARNEERVTACGRDLLALGAQGVNVIVADFRFREGYDAIFEQALAILETIDLIIVAHGVLPDQEKLDFDVNATIDNFMVNGTAAIVLSQMSAMILAKQKYGSLAVLSSVAGDRGRKRNYVYGAAKAALTTFTSGLRARFADFGVHVLTIKPGPVATPMLQGTNLPLQAKPDAVARTIVKAIDKKKAILVVPSIWRLIMFVVRQLPESIFMKLKI